MSHAGDTVDFGSIKPLRDTDCGTATTTAAALPERGRMPTRDDDDYRSIPGDSSQRSYSPMSDERSDVSSHEDEYKGQETGAYPAFEGREHSHAPSGPFEGGAPPGSRCDQMITVPRARYQAMDAELEILRSMNETFERSTINQNHIIGGLERQVGRLEERVAGKEEMISQKTEQVEWMTDLISQHTAHIRELTKNSTEVNEAVMRLASGFVSVFNSFKRPEAATGDSMPNVNQPMAASQPEADKQGYQRPTFAPYTQGP